VTQEDGEEQLYN